MFLNKVLEKNRALVKTAVNFHQQGLIEPDTYVVDYDQLLKNAQMILAKAQTKDIKLYFMLKQLGRNPKIAQALVDLGYPGAVVVDHREAQLMMQHHIPLGNVGHLVQTPYCQLEKIITYGCEVITVFSLEKLSEINEIAEKHQLKQDVIIKVFEVDDVCYRGQEGGITLAELPDFIAAAQKLTHVQIVGVTSFPVYLFDEQSLAVKATNNLKTIKKATEILNQHGCLIKQINVPSTTSVNTLNILEGTHGEPGHGLTGTTPAHAYLDLPELPAVVYVSEISHNFKQNSYCYGGGYYRRSHLKQALVVDQQNTETIVNVLPIDPTSIDYYLELDKKLPVSSSVIMAFRFQIFVTRSRVVLVKGVASNNPTIIGVYDSLGREI